MNIQHTQTAAYSGRELKSKYSGAAFLKECDYILNFKQTCSLFSETKVLRRGGLTLDELQNLSDYPARLLSSIPQSVLKSLLKRFKGKYAGFPKEAVYCNLSAIREKVQKEIINSDHPYENQDVIAGAVGAFERLYKKTYGRDIEYKEVSKPFQQGFEKAARLSELDIIAFEFCIIAQTLKFQIEYHKDKVKRISNEVGAGVDFNSKCLSDLNHIKRLIRLNHKFSFEGAYYWTQRLLNKVELQAKAQELKRLLSLCQSAARRGRRVLKNNQFNAVKDILNAKEVGAVFSDIQDCLYKLRVAAIILDLLTAAERRDIAKGLNAHGRRARALPVKKGDGVR